MIVQIYLDDGSRDAWDYNNNYFYFNGKDKEIETITKNILNDNDIPMSDKRSLLKFYCAKSFDTTNSYNQRNINFLPNILSRWRLLLKPY